MGAMRWGQCPIVSNTTSLLLEMLLCTNCPISMEAIASILDCIISVSVESFLRSFLLSPKKVTFAKWAAISGLF